MLWAKSAKKPPRVIAEMILKHIEDPDGILARMEIAGPGFLNFTFAAEFYYAQLRALAAGEHGRLDLGHGERVQVEFASVNPTGPLHVGHGRVAVIGDVLARLHEATGFDVEREYYVNDAGNQMENLGLSILARYRESFGEKVDFPEGGYPGDYIMKLLGAKVRVVEAGSRTLKDAMNEALRDWVTNVRSTYYLIGSVAGPHPYPMMVRDFQSVIGREARRQIRQKEGRLPDYLVACVGGGSNSMGLFYPFVRDLSVKMLGVEAAGRGLRTGKHAASIQGGTVGVLHGSKSYVLQNELGQITETHSIAAGLDYPGVGPELSYLRDSGRAEFDSATDQEAIAAIKLLAEVEGIIPALESAHAIAAVTKLARRLTKRQTVIVNLSGRGDKDMMTVGDYLGVKL